MSIQRYNCDAFLGPEDDPMSSLEENSDGEVVLYTGHLTDKQAALDAQEKAMALYQSALAWIGPELVPPDGGGSPHKEGLRTFWESKYGRRYPWETSWAWAVEVRRVEG